MKELEIFAKKYTNIEEHYDRQYHWRTEHEPPIPMELEVKTKSLRAVPPTWVYDPEHNNPWGTGQNYVSIIMDEQSYPVYLEECYFHPIVAIQESEKAMRVIRNMLDKIDNKVIDNWLVIIDYKGRM